MKSKIILVILPCLLLCSVGCRTSRDFRYVEKSIRQEIKPAKLDKVFRFGTGFISGPLIKCFIRDEQAKAFMKEIKKMQIGIYKVSNAHKIKEFTNLSHIEKRMAEKGWQSLMRIRSKKDGNFSVYYRFHSEKKVGLRAIILNNKEMVLAEVTGNLEKLLKKTIYDHKLQLAGNM